MLLKGLPRAQLFLPACITPRSPAIVRQLASKSYDRASNGESQPPAGRPQSLFEELFPEEARKKEKSPTVSNGSKISIRRVASSDKLEQHITQNDETLRGSQDVSVVILSNASKSLALSDFLRLSPKGEHIDGWASGIIKGIYPSTIPERNTLDLAKPLLSTLTVIPGRDPTTLTPQGHYFILFSNDAAATAYHKNLLRLHRLARQHTPTSITSPLAPPPGYIKDGEDIYALLQSYTVVPASQEHILARKPHKPYMPAMQRLIDVGGYAQIVEQQRKGGGEDALVLLTLDRQGVGVVVLRAAIGKDGRERNLQWRLAGYKEDIVRVESGKVVSDEGELEPKPEVLQEWGEEVKKTKRWQPPRFILSFKDGQEARRFVRAWHRRPFPLPIEPQDSEDEAPPMVNAELLW